MGGRVLVNVCEPRSRIPIVDWLSVLVAEFLVTPFEVGELGRDLGVKLGGSAILGQPLLVEFVQRELNEFEDGQQFPQSWFDTCMACRRTSDTGTFTWVFLFRSSVMLHARYRRNGSQLQCLENMLRRHHRRDRRPPQVRRLRERAEIIVLMDPRHPDCRISLRGPECQY